MCTLIFVYICEIKIKDSSMIFFNQLSCKTIEGTQDSLSNIEFS